MRLLYFTIIFILTNCVTIVRPDGHWNDPVLTQFYDDELKDDLVDVRCYKERDKIWVEKESDICVQLRSIISNMGAVIVEDETQVPLYTLAYIDLPWKSDFGGWGLLPCIYTGTLFPCVEDSEAAVKLVILDKNKVIVKEEIFATKFRSFYGYGALFLLARGNSATRIQLTKKLFKTMRGFLRSYKVSLKNDMELAKVK